MPASIVIFLFNRMIAGIIWTGHEIPVFILLTFFVNVTVNNKLEWQYSHDTLHRVPTHPWKSLKVLEFFSPKFKALKALENRTGAWKSLNLIPQVLESPWIHQAKLCNISSSVKQVFCLKQDLLIIVMFSFYQQTVL